MALGPQGALAYRPPRGPRAIPAPAPQLKLQALREGPATLGVINVSPAQLVKEWVTRSNAADIGGLASLYATDAVNHQVVMSVPFASRVIFVWLFWRAMNTAL